MPYPKALFVCLVICTVAFGASKIDKDIKQQKQVIANKSKEYVKLTSSLDEAAKLIISEKMNVTKIDEQVKKLDTELQALSKDYAAKEGEIKESERQKRDLMNEKDEIEKKLIDIVAKELSSAVVISKTEPSSEADLIKEQATKSLNKVVAENVKKLKDEFLQRQIKIKELESKERTIKKSMSIYEAKKKESESLKNDKQKAITTIQKQIEGYKGKLEEVAKEQQRARETLEQLNILKRQKLAKPVPAPKPSKPGEPVEPSEVANAEVDLSNDVKMMGSSYQPTKTVHYGGAKVAPPIEDFQVVKKFGNFVDPIYKIKIHNDSVILRSNEPDVMVKNIIDGKIVYAREVAALGNVVIVQHDGNLHTIYAHLSKIAPTVSPGKKISQGSIVGRIDSELMFEVTKDDTPINPLEVIRAN